MCYVKLSRKRPDFEKSKPAWSCWDSNTIFIPELISGYVLHENDHDCKEGGCKHEINSPNGEISSPHYPDYYPAKKDCVWIFTTTPGHRIKLVSYSLILQTWSDKIIVH